MSYPEDFRYTETHEWVHLENGTIKVGITDHAQNELSDVVFVECPATGVNVAAKEAIAVVESSRRPRIFTPPLAERSPLPMNNSTITRD
jgi:glycine cleavage system H protein